MAVPARAPLVLPAALACAVLLAACEAYRAPPPDLEARPAAQTVSADGLSLAAMAGRWRGFPPDLDRYYLPIEAFVSNDRPEPVPLRLEDFVLLDPSGRETRPASPREATAALFGTYGRQSRLDAGATVVPARTFFFFHGRFGYPYGYYGPYYSPYYYYWPPAYPYGYRRYGDLTGDLVRFALAETRLEPRGAAQGFLYFPRVEGDPGTLRLRWSPPPLEAGLVAPVAALD